MKILIEQLSSYLFRHPKLKEWGWFITLWCGGLFIVMIVAQAIRLLIKLLG